MPSLLRPSLLCRALLCSAALLAATRTHAQTPVTALDRVLSHIDLGVGATGEITNKVTGTNYLGQQLTQDPSSTIGALIQVRYTKSPLVGFEFNYNYARYTQNFTVPAPGVSPINGGAQNAATEYTVGYVVHTPKLMGLQPFVAGGGGSTAFRPTAKGGQGLPAQARATYYYDICIDDAILPHFGLRAQFRQAFFLAPDFGQNYLTILKRQISTEPSVGFYLRF